MSSKFNSTMLKTETFHKMHQSIIIGKSINVFSNFSERGQTHFNIKNICLV